jgi:hypothetical protein
MERVFHGGEKAIRALEADAMVYLTLQRWLPDMEWTLCDMAMEMEERGRKVTLSQVAHVLSALLHVPCIIEEFSQYV